MIARLLPIASLTLALSGGNAKVGNAKVSGTFPFLRGVGMTIRAGISVVICPSAPVTERRHWPMPSRCDSGGLGGNWLAWDFIPGDCMPPQRRLLGAFQPRLLDTITPVPTSSR